MGENGYRAGKRGWTQLDVTVSKLARRKRKTMRPISFTCTDTLPLASAQVTDRILAPHEQLRQSSVDSIDVAPLPQHA